MITVSAEVAAALALPERVLRPRLNIDWLHDGHGAAGSLDDLSPYVDGFRRSQNWQTDLPEGVRIAEGSATASLTATVARGDITGRASTVTYQGVTTTANGASPSSSWGAEPASAGTSVGSFLLVAVATCDLTLAVEQFTDITSIGAITYGSGTTGMRLWLFQHRLRPTLDPYDSLSLDFDASVVFAADSGTPYSMIILGFEGSVRNVDTFKLSAETVTGTSHTTGEVDVPDGTVLVSFYAWRTGATGTWAPTGTDTERADVRGAHATTNIALAAMTSTAVTAGKYTRTATSSASTGAVLMGVVAVSPFPARDERNHAANWLSPTNRDSPLHPLRRVRRHVQAGVEVLTSLGWQEVRRFTGWTRSIDATAARRTGEIEALDGRELMRATFNPPPVLGDYQGLNATWLISLACHASGIAASPRPVFGGGRIPQVWWPMHGSVRALHSAGVNGSLSGLTFEDGWAYGPRGDRVRPTFITGPYVMAVFASHASDAAFQAVTSKAYRYYFYDAFGGPGTRKGRVEFQVRGDTLGATSKKEAVAVKFTDGFDTNLYTYVGVAFDRRLTFRVEDGGADLTRVFGPTVPADGLWHTVGIEWDLDAGTKVIYWYLDGATSTSNPSFTATYVGENQMYELVTYMPVAEIQVAVVDTANTVPWLWAAAFTPGAVLDRSLLELSACAVRGQVEAWQFASDIASAEQAVSGFDEAGIYRYQTRARLTTGGGQTVQVTLADSTSVLDVDVSTRVDMVRNLVEVPWMQPRASVTRPEPVWLWTFSGSPVYIPTALTAVTINLPFSEIPWAVDTEIAATTSALALPNSYMIFNSSEDGNGVDVTNITPFALTWTTSGMDVTFFNTSGQDVWLIEGAIAGYAFNESAEGVGTATSTTSRKRYGDQPFKAPSSPWVQSADVATALAGLIVADLKAPKAVLGSVRIVGDPRLQKGDRVRVVDSTGLAMDQEFWLTKVDDDFQAGRYTQTLAAREASEVMVWGSFRWGEAVWA